MKAMNDTLDEYELRIGEHGTLGVTLNGHTLTIMATMDGDE
jgi:hypothetical protein